MAEPVEATTQINPFGKNILKHTLHQFASEFPLCFLKNIGIIKNLGRLLGKTDIEGQLNEIKLVNNFLDTQIRTAEDEKNKNEQMYRTLGIVAGMTITILLI